MREAPHILVVDDDPSILDLTRDILSPSYRVTTASSVQEAQEHLQAEAYDLVLTDMIMPEVGGMELLKHLRLHHTDIPVLVFTGYANFQDAVNAVKLGAFDYLTNPMTTVPKGGMLNPGKFDPSASRQASGPVPREMSVRMSRVAVMPKSALTASVASAET